MKTNTFNTNGSQLLQFESTDQPAKKKKKNHKNKSSKKILEDEGFLNSESAIDYLVPETKRKRKHSNTFSTDESLLQVESKNQPSLKTKKSHKKHSSEKINQDIGISKQHCSNSRTKRKHRQSNIFDVDGNQLLQYESTDQPAKKKKKSHKNKSSKTILEEGSSNQYSTNSETAIDPLIPEIKRKHKHSNTLETDERLFSQLESTDQRAKKTKKSKRNFSPSKQIYNDGILNSETATDHLVAETKRKHKHSNIFETDERLLLQLESTDQLAKKTKKSKSNNSPSKQLHNDEGFPNQHCLNLETATDQLVPETKRKPRHSNIFDADENLVILYESKDHPSEKKKKTHKNKSQRILEDEAFSNQHCSNSETASNQLVSDEEKKPGLSKILDTDESLLPQHEQYSNETCHKLCSNTKLTHKSKSSCERLLDDDKCQTDNDYNSKLNSHCHSSGKILESIEQDECTNSRSKELINTDSLMHFSMPALDFTEEPVTFDVPLLHSTESVKMLSEEERKYLESNGEIIKTGRFSTAEDAILKRNYENFTRRFGVNDPYLLLGLGKKRRDEEVAKFLKAKHFYVRLGEGLNDRSLRAIYIRSRLLFDPSRGKGRFDNEEVTQLKKLHYFVGNQWAEIGNVIDRNANTARSAFLWYDKHVKKGKWTSEERSNLIKAIEVVAGTTDVSKVPSDMIFWEKVARLVPTRNLFQCREHWLEDLSWSSEGTVWNSSYYCKLISILCNECYVENYEDVDWKRVQKCFCDSTDISPSWVFLRKKWYTLKKSLPREHNMNYKQMLNFLSTKYIDPPLLILD